jgi:PAS domain S-box-containing protein
MKNKIPIPQNEEERLAALHNFQIIDSLPEEQYDRLTKLAAIICGTPIAYISFIDKDTQWFKSKIGVKAEQLPREASICQYTILGQELLEIEDALQDERVKDNPLVIGKPHLRFYAGHPLMENDIVYGSLCVMGDKPKKLTESQKLTLKILSQEVVSQMNFRKKELETEKLERLFSLSIDMICIASTDGYFKKTNPAVEHTLGYTEKELLGIPFSELLHPEDLEVSLKEIEKLATGVKTVGFENRFKTKDGSYRLISWVATPDPVTGELFSVGRDITEKRNTEKELFRIQERFRTFINNSQGIMCTHSGDGKLLYVNEATTHMLGYSKEELEGKSITVMLAPETKSDLVNYLEVVNKKGSAEGLMKVMTKGGSKKIWKYNNVKIFNDEEAYIVSNALDITELIYIEKELKKAKDLAERNAMAKDVFLANMSHEIRTPMNAIIGFSELLAATELNSDQKEFVDAVQIAGENLLVIINDILDFSKIESNSFVLEKTPISLREILSQVKKLLTQKIIEKKIGFNFYVEDGIPESVLGDKVRLTQILINIIGNAIKFTDHGKVEVFCSLLYKDETNCVIEFRIKDTGIGIPADKQSVIFERFKQADNNTTRKYGGTGLGLSISKKLTELFGGTIQLVSQEGIGAEFIIQLPMQTSERSTKNNLYLKKDTSIQKDISILLVEDNELNQRLATKILQKNGIRSTTAKNGQEAIKLLSSQSFDLILMDLQMPVMDGYTATLHIRDELKLQIPIIAMTAHSLVGEKTKCIASGMNDYLSKPYRAINLIEKISDLVNKETTPARKENFATPGNAQSKKEYHIAHLEELANGDDSFISESITVFLKIVPEGINDLREAISNNDLISVKKTAHQLKTSYAFLEVNSAIDMCSVIENTKDTSSLPLKFDDLKEFTVLLIKDIEEECKHFFH